MKLKINCFAVCNRCVVANPDRRSGLAEGYTMRHCAILLHLTSNQDLQLRHGPYKQHKLCIRYYYCINLHKELAQSNKHNSLLGHCQTQIWTPVGGEKETRIVRITNIVQTQNMTLFDRLLHTQTLSTVSTAVWICYIIHLVMWMAYW